MSPRRRGAATAARAVDAPAGEDAGRTEKAQVWLGHHTRRRLRMWSALLDRDISDVVEEAIVRYLDTMDRERAAKGLPAVPLE